MRNLTPSVYYLSVVGPSNRRNCLVACTWSCSILYTTNVHCSKIYLVVDESKPVGVVLVGLYVCVITHLPIIEVAFVTKELCSRTVCLKISNDFIIGEIEFSTVRFKRNPSWFAEELEVNIEWKSIASHNQIVSEKSSTSSYLAHITISMA